MKTGDTFLSACASSDSKPRTWTVCECLGQGTWGQSFLVRDGDGQERVLKVPLRLEDFPSDTAMPPDIGKLCAEAAEEQARALGAGDVPWLPRLEARLTLEDGRPALLLPRYSATLARRLEAGMPLVSALQVVQRICAMLAATGRVHGNLRPSNILLTDRGDPVLADGLTPALERALVQLECRAPERADWRPPEARGAARGVWDTWALCHILWQAAMTRDAGHGPPRLEVPDQGLDKLTLATLKDRAMARLSGERTNARFRNRLAERLGAVLNRGLSRPSEPSPPYRFLEAADLLHRLQEVTALISPEVVEVGRILLGAQADPSGTFQGGDGIRFSVSVACSPGVHDHEDVVCGLQLVDVDAPDGARVPLNDAKFAVTSHPSGRLRFQFDVPDVPPGRYRIRSAFSIKDSGQEPQVAEGRFEVRPPPGYVPPAEPEAPSAIAFPPRSRPASQETEVEPDHAVEGELERPAVATTGAGPSVPREPEAPRSAVTALQTGAPDGRPPAVGVASSAETEAPTAGWATSPGDISDPGAEIIEGLFPRPLAPPEEDLEEAMEAPRPRQPAVQPTPVLVEVEETEATYASVGGHPHSIARPSGVHAAPTEEARHGTPAPQPPRPVAFPAAVARPSIAMPGPSLQRAASPSPAPRPPAAVAPPPPAAAAAPVTAEVELDPDDWDLDSPEWDTLSGDGADFGIDDEALPLTEGEDLPSWRQHRLRFDASRIPGLNRAIELVQRDSYTAFVAAVAASFVLLLACMAILRAC